eukprot:TRINITY_DN11584_c0_g1_i2.p1 TRINITY_DN11584_c0_g1~~TRINITY_DN11584_c0_g1_i2.p1  ORF type:complete len:174 (-),score=11.88 TRINITY_DN11584_c0_g1_i2:71-592(-)
MSSHILLTKWFSVFVAVVVVSSFTSCTAHATPWPPTPTFLSIPPPLHATPLDGTTFWGVIILVFIGLLLLIVGMVVFACCITRRVSRTFPEGEDDDGEPLKDQDTGRPKDPTASAMAAAAGAGAGSSGAPGRVAAVAYHHSSSSSSSTTTPAGPRPGQAAIPMPPDSAPREDV